MRRWARVATAGVSVVAGVLIAAVPHWLDAVGEADDGHPSTLATALGIAVIAAGALTAFVAHGRYLVIALLGTLFVLAFWGNLADDTYYGGIAGITLVLIGLLSLIGNRGARRRLAQPQAPVRQLRRPRMLRAEHRVRRPRRRPIELRGRDPPDAAVEPGLREDRLREVGPRAVAVGGDVVDAVRQVEHRAGSRRRGGRRRSGEPRWSSTTATSSCSAPSAQHRADEVVAGRAEEPRRADDPAVAHLALAARASCGRRRRAGSGRSDSTYGSRLRAVEDVVGREVDDRRAAGDDVRASRRR